MPVRPELSIVIPVLNDAPSLEKLMQDLAQQNASFDVIVVDAGGDAETAAIAERFDASLLASEAGRGQQLATGVSGAAAPSSGCCTLTPACRRMPFKASCGQPSDTPGAAAGCSSPGMARLSTGRCGLSPR